MRSEEILRRDGACSGNRFSSELRETEQCIGKRGADERKTMPSVVFACCQPRKWWDSRAPTVSARDRRSRYRGDTLLSRGLTALE